jgi:uncharacterized SAM-binding protein YcdF (DUF218 family)
VTEAVIVIFGAAVRADGSPSTALRQRVEAAWEFGRDRADILYLPTGGTGRHGPSEASVMAGLLQAQGVPAGRILLEETATDTVSSVRAVGRMLRARGHRGPVYVATSAYHLPRCLVLMRIAGMDARPVPPGPGAAARRFRRRWYWRLREVPALPADALLVLWLRLTGQL